jgi:hypothetical protein
MAMTSKNRNADIRYKIQLAYWFFSFRAKSNDFMGELSELINEVPDFKSHLEIKLIGSVSQEVLETISQFGLDSYLNNLGYVSHGEAIAHQRRSQVLLLIEIDSEDTKSIPGKLFEYMVSNRPIIGIGPKNSDFAEITTTNTGCFLTIQRK